MWKLVARAALLAAPAAALTVAMPASAAEQVSPQAAADALLAADRQFSAAAKDKPLVDGIAAMLDDGVIMPTPDGKFAKNKAEAIAVLSANPANANAKAEWAPVRAGISADGRHGFTYGFMTIREDGKADRRAKYLAYWVKRPEGWRVAAYKRAPSADGAVATALRTAALPARLASPDARPHAAEAHRASLIAAEKGFSDEAQRIGVGPAFKNHGSADAMNMGSGPDFVFGNEQIAEAVSGPPTNAPTPIHWAADEGALVASSGDLGVTFGYIRLHKPDPNRPGAIPFFTIWRRDTPQQPWRYVAE